MPASESRLTTAGIPGYNRQPRPVATEALIHFPRARRVADHGFRVRDPRLDLGGERRGPDDRQAGHRLRQSDGALDHVPGDPPLDALADVFVRQDDLRALLAAELPGERVGPLLPRGVGVVHQDGLLVGLDLVEPRVVPLRGPGRARHDVDRPAVLPHAHHVELAFFDVDGVLRVPVEPVGPEQRERAARQGEILRLARGRPRPGAPLAALRLAGRARPRHGAELHVLDALVPVEDRDRRPQVEHLPGRVADDDGPNPELAQRFFGEPPLGEQVVADGRGPLVRPQARFDPVDDVRPPRERAERGPGAQLRRPVLGVLLIVGAAPVTVPRALVGRPVVVTGDDPLPPAAPLAACAFDGQDAPLSGSRPRVRLRRLVAEVDAQLGRQLADGVGEGQALALLDPLEHAAAGPAAEAVVEPGAGRDVERRRPFVVERTAADEVAALAPEGHGRPDHGGEVGAVADRVEGVLRKRHQEPPPNSRT